MKKQNNNKPIKMAIHNKITQFYYIWFMKIMQFFTDSHVIYCYNKRALVIFSSMRPLVASGEKPKAFFTLIDIIAF